MAVRRRKVPKVGKKGAAKAANKKALWQAYRHLQKRADTAWKKFRSDVKRNARSSVLVKDHNHLLLLLGECNYMARECARLNGQKTKKRR
ncbi:MAG TPA: hypothetical protein VLF94_03640 [Chlamydiales bacterium]|nr:hypothetical protein [Chlamydiales bacterium]